MIRWNIEKIKKYMEENNIKLIRIPYYELNNIPNFLNKAIMSQAIESK